MGFDTRIHILIALTIGGIIDLGSMLKLYKENTLRDTSETLENRGETLSKQSLCSLRCEAEGCDCLQGFQLCHSLGGGTGETGFLILASGGKGRGVEVG